MPCFMPSLVSVLDRYPSVSDISCLSFSFFSTAQLHLPFRQWRPIHLKEKGLAMFAHAPCLFWNWDTFWGWVLNEILRLGSWGNPAPHSHIHVIVALFFLFGLIQPKWIRILAQIESSFPPGEASRTYCDKISQWRLPPQYETSVKKIPRIYFNLDENIKRNHFQPKSESQQENNSDWSKTIC